MVEPLPPTFSTTLISRRLSADSEITTCGGRLLEDDASEINSWGSEEASPSADRDDDWSPHSLLVSDSAVNPDSARAPAPRSVLSRPSFTSDDPTEVLSSRLASGSLEERLALVCLPNFANSLLPMSLSDDERGTPAASG